MTPGELIADAARCQVKSLSSELDRLEVVDALRGWAVCGLFAVHMLESYELFWARPDHGFITKLVFILFSGKCFAIMALCFGFSFYMLVDHDSPPRPAAVDLYLRRLTFLGIFGFIHSLLYRGDILLPLALLGAPLLLISWVRSNWILIAIATFLFLQPSMLADMFMAPDIGPAMEGYRDVSMSVYQHGGLGEVIRTNIWDGQIPKWSFMLKSGRLIQTVGLMLWGIVLGRTGFFRSLTRTRMANLVLLVGAMLAVGFLHLWQRSLVSLACSRKMSCEMSLGTIVQGWEQLAMTLGWVAAICIVWVSGGRTVLRPFSFVGRAALSFYVAQSVTFVPLFYHFGAGLADVWSPAYRLAAAVAGCLLQLWLAALWFRHFAYGPLEWIWRALTLGRTDIPFRRTLPVSIRASTRYTPH
jgi:uncharacterized protein